MPNFEISHREPLSVLWRFCAASRTLMGLLGLLALALLLATLIPQIPAHQAGDPQAWLATQSGFGGWENGLIRALGLYNVYRVWWFHLLLALTGLVLFIWIVESAELAWRAARARWPVSSFVSWGSNAPQICLPSTLALDNARARLADFMTQRGYRWTDVPLPTAPNLVASHRAILLWAQPVAYGALVVALAGLGVMGNWGWQNEDWQPIPGESQSLGHGSPYAVRLDAFELLLEGDEHLCDFASEISWLEDRVVLGQDTVSIGHPARLQGIAVRQVGYGPVARVYGQDENGHSLTFQTMGEELSVPGTTEVVFATAGARHFVLIPSHNLVLALTFELVSAEAKPLLHVSLLPDGGGEQQYLGSLYASGVMAVDGLQVNIELDYRPILRVDYRPGMVVVIGGSVLALVALALMWVVPPHLLWIAVLSDTDDSTLVQILALPGARGDQWLSRLASQLQEVLADDD
jgi:hypothetical protein